MQAFIPDDAVAGAAEAVEEESQVAVFGDECIFERKRICPPDGAAGPDGVADDNRLSAAGVLNALLRQRLLQKSTSRRWTAPEFAR